MLPNVEFGLFYDVSMQWQVPFAVAICYLCLSWMANRYLSSHPPAKKASAGLTAVIVVHNAILTIFSAIVAYKTLVPFYEFAKVKGFFGALADESGAYRNGCLAYWSFIFYLSKYYELLDSAILIAKGKPISLLQAYHHAGIIIAMWGLASTGTAAAFCLMTLNACIHTIMYTYYMLAALKIRMPFKQMITSLQIVQFIVGEALSTVYIFIAKRNLAAPLPHDAWAHTFGFKTQWMSELTSIVFAQTYVFPLILLFALFYLKNYSTTDRRPKRD